MKKIILGVTVLLSFISLTSCDKDYNTIGSEVVGNDHFDFEKRDISVLVQNSLTGPVQSNNLPVNHLGILNDPAFGITKASFVTQLELLTENPIIGNEGTQVIDSVYVYIPYFVDSDLTETDTDGSKTYVLDSVYNYNETSKFKLHVYENGYFLRDFDPADNFQSSQKYYTNDKASKIDPNKGSELLNNSSDLSQNELFYISNKEIVIYETDGIGNYVDENGNVLTNQTDVTLRIVKERKAPGIWLDLKKSFFEQMLFGSAANGKLYNNALFKDYMRGLVFEVEEITPGVGSMATLDLSKAEFKVLFKSENTITNPDGSSEITTTRKTLNLGIGYNGSNRKANTINLMDYSLNADFNNNFVGGVNVNSGQKMYIKGGDGAIVYIDIPQADIDMLRAENILVNEANLVFYIDKSESSGMGNSSQYEPERIYLFDATNNTPILDYFSDPSTNQDVKKNKSSFGGIIEKEEVNSNEPKKGIKYKIKLTSHINRVINGDSDENENIRLGLVVTENINVSSNAFVFLNSSTRVPLGSVMSPLGTVLHGPNSTEVYTDPDTGEDIPMKLKLELFYTKPN